MNEHKRLNFLNSENSLYILEMYENYFQNSESEGKIQQFIESYVQIEDAKFLQLTAIEEFSQAFNNDGKRTICFLSSLARYLKNNLQFNVESLNSDQIKTNQKILRDSIYRSISMFSCNNRDDKELELMIKYELLVRNKESKNYSKSLELIEEMLNTCSDAESKGIRLFEKESGILHFLASFNDPRMYIQLQFNLIHSKLGNNLSQMRFDSINKSICFSRYRSDGKRISGKEYEEKFEKSSLVMYNAARALLDDCKIHWKNESETQVFEQFFFLILDVLIRRYQRTENNFGRESLIDDKKIFSKVERLIERSHLSDNLQSSSPNLEDSLSSSAVRNWLSKHYSTLFDSLKSKENNTRSRYSQISILRDSIGDIDENAPLAEKRKSRSKHIPAIQYFHRNDLFKTNDGNLILNEKIRHDLSNGIQGKLNRSNIYSDSVLLNMMKVGKIQNVPSGLKLDKLAFMEPVEILNRLQQKSTGQFVELSSIKMIQMNKVPLTHFSTDTKRWLDEIPKLKSKLQNLGPTFHFSTYFASGYNVLQFGHKQKVNGKIIWKITRSTKLDRLNVIAKGLSELREIVYTTIPGISKSDDLKGYRENLLASESHPLLIIPERDAAQMTEFERTVYSIPFITHRISEVVNLLAELNQHKQNLPMPFPYKKRYPTLINKYANLIQLETRRLLKFIEQLRYECNFDIDSDWVQKYETNLENLQSDRELALYEAAPGSVRKFRGKNSAYKPLEVEREFVSNLMMNEFSSMESSVTGYLNSMVTILNRIMCDGIKYSDSDQDCVSIFEQLVHDVFGEDGKYSPDELIVGAIAGVNLARGWSH